MNKGRNRDSRKIQLQIGIAFVLIAAVAGIVNECHGSRADREQVDTEQTETIIN